MENKEQVTASTETVQENLEQNVNQTNVNVEKAKNAIDGWYEKGLIQKGLFIGVAALAVLYALLGMNLKALTSVKNLGDSIGNLGSFGGFGALGKELAELPNKLNAVKTTHGLVFFVFIVVLVLFGLLVYKAKDKGAFFKNITNRIVAGALVVAFILELQLRSVTKLVSNVLSYMDLKNLSTDILSGLSDKGSKAAQKMEETGKLVETVSKKTISINNHYFISGCCSYISICSIFIIYEILQTKRIRCRIL